MSSHTLSFTVIDSSFLSENVLKLEESSNNEFRSNEDPTLLKPDLTETEKVDTRIFYKIHKRLVNNLRNCIQKNRFADIKYLPQKLEAKAKNPNFSKKDFSELVKNFKLNLDFQITSCKKNEYNIESFRCLEEIIKYYLENEILRNVMELEVELRLKKKFFHKLHKILLEYDEKNIQ